MRTCDGSPEQPPCELDERARFSVVVVVDGSMRNVGIVGDIDLSARTVLHSACVADDSTDVFVDLGAATFLDCSGYGALVSARCELEARGGSLSWFGPTGQPQRFLTVLGVLEQAS